MTLLDVRVVAILGAAADPELTRELVALVRGAVAEERERCLAAAREAVAALSDPETQRQAADIPHAIWTERAQEDAREASRGYQQIAPPHHHADR